MNLLNLWRPQANKANPVSDFGRILEYERLAGSRRTSDTVDTDKAYILAMTSSWVYANIKLICDRISEVEFQMERSTEILETHPALKIINRPNSLMVGTFLKRYTLWWYLLRGNAYWFLSTPQVGSGQVKEIWPLIANLVRPLPETLRQGVGIFTGRQVIDYEYNISGRIETLPGENVVHFRTPNPFDYWEGLSPLTAAMLPIQTDIAQGDWQRDFFQEDNAIPSALLSFPSTTSPTDFERQRELISAQLREGQKRIFTRAGDLKVETITQTLEQMQILESRRFTKEQIDRIYGIPDGIFSSASSRDSILASEITFTKNTIQPLLNYMTQQLNGDFAPYFGEDLLVAPDIVPQDKALAVQEHTIYGQDRTLLENRELLGLGTLEIPPEYRELLNIPIRLLQWVAPTVAIPKQQVELPPEVGDLAGSQLPENLVEDLANKSLNEELRRWKAVCLRCVKEGKPALSKIFKTTIIPDVLYVQITEALKMAASEQEVKTVFETVPFWSEDLNYP